MSTSHEARARQLMTDPIGFFDQSVTKMHSIPREELEALQRTAMSIRFREHYESIEILRKLADRLNITEVNEFNDVVPLFFAHTAFKSYPAVLLEKKRFDLMTNWLDKQTCYDLSNVDVTGCDSVDQWIDMLDEQTPLQVITSSGTTGTLSIIPKSKAMTEYGMRLWYLFLFQTFGKEPTNDELNAKVDVVWPKHAKGTVGTMRSIDYIKTIFTGGDESRFHALYPNAIETDLLLLASRMRAAAVKGELDRLEIDPKLLARKEEFEALQAKMPEDMNVFLKKCFEELAGKRVFMLGTYAMLYEVAAGGRERGIKNLFAPNSAILTGGGMKGHELPDNYLDIIKEFLGVDRIQEGYGFSEGSTFHWACEHGRYHVQPWSIPFLLDPDTSEPLPRKGVQTGRAAFYDLLSEAHWGGVISGDEITIDWDTPCPCGRSSIHIAHDIMRYSEKQGVDDDRITCSATQEVNDEAINFMKDFEG